MNNSVEFMGYYGGDKTHCLSAWTSTFEELGIDLSSIPLDSRVDVMFDEIRKTKQKTPDELLDMLASHGHHTPFEKSMIHFLVNSEIATHIQLLKHRIGVSINGESARYKELKEDKFYLPEDFKLVKESDDEYPDMQATWYKKLKDYTEYGNRLYHACLADLTPVLGRKRAKESARFFKTYNSQITVDISLNFRSFMHFQKLGNDEHAQLEIREIAEQMLECVSSIEGNPFEYSLKAFNY